MSFFGLFKPDPKRLEEKGDINGLIKAMGNTDDKIRIQAVQSLCRITKKEHRDLLLDRLNAKQWRQRAGVVEVLGYHNDEGVSTAILEALKDEHAEVRRKAAEALERLKYQPKNEAERVRVLLGKGNWYDLGELGEDAVEPLVDALKWGDSNVRSFVVMALSQIGGERSLEVFSRLLQKDEDSNVKLNALLALKAAGSKAIQPLISVIGDPVWEIRSNAAETLASIGPEAVEPLVEALRSGEEYARSRASYALGIIKDSRAVQPLMELLKDKKETVRWNAAKALGDIGDPAALEALKETLKDEVRSVQWQATLALARYGEEGTNIILEGLHAKGNYCTQDLAAALGEAKEVRAVPHIIKMLDSSQKEVRWNSVVALGKMGDSRALKPLIGQLGDRDSEMRANIIFALGEIGDPSVVEALTDSLTDRDSKVRAIAVSTLAKIGDVKVVPSLMNALDDGSAGVRSEAVRALGALGDSSALLRLEEIHAKTAPNQRYALERAIAEIKKRSEA
jgi:HEAT repeat protein